MLKAHSWANLSTPDSQLCKRLDGSWPSEPKQHSKKHRFWWRKRSSTREVNLPTSVPAASPPIVMPLKKPNNPGLERVGSCDEINNNSYSSMQTPVHTPVSQSCIDIHRLPAVSESDDDDGRIGNDQLYGVGGEGGGGDPVARAHSLGDLTSGLTFSVVGQRKADSLLNLSTFQERGPKNKNLRTVSTLYESDLCNDNSQKNNNMNKENMRDYMPDSHDHDHRRSSPPKRLTSPHQRLTSPQRVTSPHQRVTSPSNRQTSPRQQRHTPGGRSSVSSNASREKTPLKAKRSLPSVPVSEASERIKRFTELMKARMALRSADSQSPATPSSMSASSLRDDPLTPAGSVLPDRYGAMSPGSQGSLRSFPGDKTQFTVYRNSEYNEGRHRSTYDRVPSGGQLSKSVNSVLGDQSVDSSHTTLTSTTMDSGYITNPDCDLTSPHSQRPVYMSPINNYSQRPSFSSPQYNSVPRPSFSSPQYSTAPKPSFSSPQYGTAPKPSFTSPQQAISHKPTYTSPQNHTASRTTYTSHHISDRPSFTSPLQPSDQRPSFTSPLQQRSNFTSVQQRPSFTSPVQQRPSFTSPVQQRPSFTSPVQQRPSFISPVQQRPNFTAPVQQSGQRASFTSPQHSSSERPYLTSTQQQRHQIPPYSSANSTRLPPGDNNHGNSNTNIHRANRAALGGEKQGDAGVGPYFAVSGFCPVKEDEDDVCQGYSYDYKHQPKVQRNQKYNRDIEERLGYPNDTDSSPYQKVWEHSSKTFSEPSSNKRIRNKRYHEEDPSDLQHNRNDLIPGVTLTITSRGSPPQSKSRDNSSRSIGSHDSCTNQQPFQYSTLPGNFRFGGKEESRSKSPPAKTPTLYQLTQAYTLHGARFTLPAGLPVSESMRLVDKVVELQGVKESSANPDAVPSWPPQGQYATLGGPGSAFRPVRSTGATTYSLVSVQGCQQDLVAAGLVNGDLLIEMNGRLILGADAKLIHKTLEIIQGEIILTVARAKTDADQSSVKLDQMVREIDFLRAEIAQRDTCIKDLKTASPWRQGGTTTDNSVDDVDEIPTEKVEISDDEFIV